MARARSTCSSTPCARSSRATPRRSCCVRATGSIAKSSARSSSTTTARRATICARSVRRRSLPFGGPNSAFAFLTERHARAHGLVREDYACVALAQRAWATRNPGAVYRSPLTLEEYLAAPLVAPSMCRYDCVPVVAGADAVVLTTADRARGPAVHVRALRERVQRRRPGRRFAHDRLRRACQPLNGGRRASRGSRRGIPLRRLSGYYLQISTLLAKLQALLAVSQALLNWQR